MSSERLQDHWSSGYFILPTFNMRTYNVKIDLFCEIQLRKIATYRVATFFKMATKGLLFFSLQQMILFDEMYQTVKHSEDFVILLKV